MEQNLLCSICEILRLPMCYISPADSSTHPLFIFDSRFPAVSVPSQPMLILQSSPSILEYESAQLLPDSQAHFSAHAIFTNRNQPTPHNTPFVVRRVLVLSQSIYRQCPSPSHATIFHYLLTPVPSSSLPPSPKYLSYQPLSGG